MALVTLAVTLGFGRLFAGTEFVVPVVVAAVVAHAVAWRCRETEVATGLAALATVGAAALSAAWTVLGHTTAYGLPLPHTLRVAVDELRGAREAFEVVQAPTDAAPGFVLALVLAVGVAAFMADWAAFRLNTAIEALVPAFTLFVFTAALGTDRHRVPSVVGFAATALAFLVVHRLTTRSRLAWFGGRPARGPAAIARAAGILGGGALLAGFVLGPAMPGYGSEPLADYRNEGPSGPSSRSTVSPLVDIRGRLVEQSDLEVFTVAANQRAYWRLTSLDTFDGQIWKSNATYRSAGRDLGTDEALVPGLQTVRATQEFTIGALDSIWLPAAFRPEEIDGIDGVSYNPDTASLITDDATSDGATYTVESVVPTGIAAETLATAPARAPAPVVERYLALPEIARPVAALARDITAPHATPYGKARALQDFFRGGSFTYELSARQGHDAGALANFLFRTRRGYCEQFAGAYAVLARLAGLPTRVAVGFTPGELGPDGLYHVRDEHAHAWPEVYLHGFGWTLFEPTPGRGAPNASSWTGQAEEQDESGPSTTPSTATTVAPQSPSESTPAPLPDEPVDAGGGPIVDDDPGPTATVRVLAALAIALGVWAVLVPALHLLRLRRRRRVLAGRPGRALGGEVPADGAALDADRVVAAWTHAAEALERSGVRRRPSETLGEFSARAPSTAGLAGEAATALRTLGRDAAGVVYAPPGSTDPETAGRAVSASTTVRSAVLGQLSVPARVLWWLDPRPLLRELTRRDGA
ncbi:MAG TPA: DUF3488 and transglutaminase-like domain-containing protein [Acidimicrobiales bacterium]|nr:DUF3488 and transglutaminase-like domain-containing protein [Acidimicrobiales bacterium]